MRTGLQVSTVAIMLGLIALSAGSAVAQVTGYNSILDSTGGNLYIPFQTSTSGELGLSLGGSSYVGLQPDRVTVQSGQTVMGYVTYKLTFDLTEEFAPLEVLDRASAGLHLTFDDLDLVPQNLGSGGTTARLWEALELSFLRDASATGPGATVLSLDQENYGQYLHDEEVGGSTNNASVLYDIHLLDDLGLTQADFDDIDADHEFALYVKLTSYIQATGRNNVTIANTGDAISANDFEFNKILLPEPASLSMLGLGAIALLRRRRA